MGPLKRDNLGSRRWSQTTSSSVISIRSAEDANLSNHFYIGLTSCTLINNDKCVLNSWVVVRQGGESTSIARAIEMLQIAGSDSEFSRKPDLILLELYERGAMAEIYRLPTLIKSKKFALAPFRVLSSLSFILTFNLS